MAGALLKGGFFLVQKPEDADIIIVNTCAFIRPAVEESVEEILELARFKGKKCRILAVAGCLPRRYGRAIKEALPEVDLFLGPGDIPRLVSSLNKLLSGMSVPFHLFPPKYLMSHQERLLLPATPYAYVKIAEGCSNFCSYCLIPHLRGKKRSRPPDDILLEVEALARSGVKEIILIAQDTTAYGTDLPQRPTLEDLLKDLSAIPSVSWIRLLYTHPARLRESLLKVMGESEKICPYLDLPIQHVNDRILKAMNRRYDRRHVEKIINMARAMVPNIALRTTIMVGFPGETEKRFEELFNFIKWAKFDHLGTFAFYPEEGTKAAKLSLTYVPRRVKEERLHLLMEEQAAISREANERQVGLRQKILIEGVSEKTDFPYRGRTPRQAPEIDGVTYVRGEKAKIGEVVEGLIVAADTYDLYAECT